MLSGDSKTILFKFLSKQISLEEMEPYLYQTEEIELNFNYDDFIELLSLNVKKNESNYTAVTLIKKNIILSEYETWRLNSLFDTIKNKTEFYPDHIVTLYHLYNEGYTFLEKLGLEFGLTLFCPLEFDYNLYYYELSQTKQNQLADHLYPHILKEVQKVQTFLLEKKQNLIGF